MPEEHEQIIAGDDNQRLLVTGLWKKFSFVHSREKLTAQV